MFCDSFSLFTTKSNNPPFTKQTLYKIYFPLQTIVPHIPVHLPPYTACQLCVLLLDCYSSCVNGQQDGILHELPHVRFGIFMKHLHRPLRPPHWVHISFPHLYLLLCQVMTLCLVFLPPVVLSVRYFLYQPVTQHKTYTCPTCLTFSINKLTLH